VSAFLGVFSRGAEEIVRKAGKKKEKRKKKRRGKTRGKFLFREIHREGRKRPFFARTKNEKGKTQEARSF